MNNQTENFQILEKVRISLIFRIYRLLRFFSIKKEVFVRILSGPLRNFFWYLNSSNVNYLLGIYDEKTIEFFEKLIKPGMIIYDLGANEGYFSIYASALTGPSGKVFSFEPFPTLIEIFRKNTKKNKIDNIKIFPLAVSNKTGSALFSNSFDLSGNTYISESPLFDLKKDCIAIHCISLDQLLMDRRIDPPGLIKIDVEGAEFDVLTGAEKMIRKYKPDIILSTHDFHRKNTCENCLKLLNGWGYKLSRFHGSEGSLIQDFIACYQNAN